MVGSKLKHENFSSNYLTKNKFLDSNLKTYYFLDMKNIFKPYIIGVLRINVCI